ncbi:hypothetical protein Dimus_031731 [Dionaea muscipula]
MDADKHRSKLKKLTDKPPEIQIFVRQILLVELFDQQKCKSDLISETNQRSLINSVTRASDGAPQRSDDGHRSVKANQSRRMGSGDVYWRRRFGRYFGEMTK